MECLLNESPDWEVVTYANLTSDDIVVNFSPLNSRKVFPSVDKKMDELWQSKLKENPRIYNASKFRLQNASLSSQLNLWIGLTDYKETICTNHSDQLKDIEAHGQTEYNDLHACFGDALGVGGVVVTIDNFIVLIKRSDWVAEAKGLIDTPGGHAEPEFMLKKLGAEISDIFQLDVSHVIHEIFHSFVREVIDEVNLPESSLSWPRLMGILRNKQVGGKPGMVFMLRCSLNQDEVEKLYLQGGLEADESTGILFIPVKEFVGAYGEELTSMIDSMAPLGKAALLLYRHYYDQL